MNYIKSYKAFKESSLSISKDIFNDHVYDIYESINVWHDALLDSINAEEVNIFDTLKLLPEDFSDNLDIDYLSDSVEFINSLSSLALKKSEVQNSEDFQTFLNKPCKFMFIYEINSNELENPQYLLFQTWIENLNKWSEVKLYEINDDVKKFYDKLTSKTIEIVDGDDSYIYTSDNANEWILQNVDKENDVYKHTFRKDDLRNLINDNKLKVNIV